MTGRRKGFGGANRIVPSMLGAPAQRQIEAIRFALQERDRQRLEALAVQQGKQGQGEAKRTKYRAKRTVVDGIGFHSKLEADRYVELRRRERLGLIADLELQPAFRLVVNGRLICTYYADFRYRVATTGEQRVEDAKGYKTPEYKLKKSLAEALYQNLEIIEVKSWRT
ncbi:hypothetical protein [Azospirillum argentinense]